MRDGGRVETFKRTPLQLFNLPQHFVNPPFQRPYVWNEHEQWEPLWKDIRRVAELRIVGPRLNALHFLGAFVLSSKRLMTCNVIDGQRRLTTLQILADAAGVILAQGVSGCRSTGRSHAMPRSVWTWKNPRSKFVISAAIGPPSMR